MGALEFALNQSGSITVTTPAGAEFQLSDRGDTLEVHARNGAIAVLPRSANVVELAVTQW